MFVWSRSELFPAARKSAVALPTQHDQQRCLKTPDRTPRSLASLQNILSPLTTVHPEAVCSDIDTLSYTDSVAKTSRLHHATVLPYLHAVTVMLNAIPRSVSGQPSLLQCHMIRLCREPRRNQSSILYRVHQVLQSLRRPKLELRHSAILNVC